jgi:hypothetical protein
MDFKDLLRQRLHVSYTRKLFRLVPKELIPILRKILLYSFDEKPGYQEIRDAL